MLSNIGGIFEDSEEEVQKKEKHLDPEYIKQNKWGQSKKSKKRNRKQKNIKKRINLLELEFTLLIND